MVKKADKQESTSQPADAAPDEDVRLATRVVQDITGCGEPEAQRRVKAMAAKKISKIAGLEREGKRPQIVAILYS